MRFGRVFQAFLLVFGLFVTVGCGDDSDRNFRPQAIFRARATAGSATFRLRSLITGGSIHEVEDAVYAVDNSTYTFVVVNAPPPYQAVFEWVSGDSEIEVSGLQVPATETVTEIIGASDRVASVCLGEVVLGLCRRGVDESLATEHVGTEVRFNVCAVLNEGDRCNMGVDLAGPIVTGSVGDALISHVLGFVDNSKQDIATPFVLYLEKPKDNVSGIFRALAGQRLWGEMFVDGERKSGMSAEKDLVLKRDI